MTESLAHLDDSSSDDDEELNKLRQAVAQNFEIESPNSSKKIKLNGHKTSNLNGEAAQRSNRTDIKDVNEKWNSGHFESITLSTDSQAFLAKKLASALDKQIKESNKTLGKKQSHTEEESLHSIEGIFLFSNSESKFTSQDFESSGKKRKKKHRFDHSKLKKRKRKDDDTESDDEESKLKSVAVSSDWVYQNN